MHISEQYRIFLKNNAETRGPILYMFYIVHVIALNKKNLEVRYQNSIEKSIFESKSRNFSKKISEIRDFLLFFIRLVVVIR